MRGRDARINRTNFDAILELAEKRADRRSGNVLAKSKQEKAKRRKQVERYLDKYAKIFGIPKISKIIDRPKPQKGSEIKKEYDKLKVDNSKDPIVKESYKPEYRIRN